ncbi:hypothetical protein FRC14_003269 [Serendipita sp. 396]|nr:hypothetical protein FRC14_003269 [Serendipita sp. 396]
MDDVGQTPATLGLSPLFPAVPILSFLSFFCCIILLPGIIKTRIFALIFYVLWVALGSILIAVNMCIWRNRVFDAPIYSDIAARIIHVYPITLYLSVLCCGKFTCNITRPSSLLKIVDKRRRYNYVDAFLCIGIPLLWSPLLMTATRGRYRIVEDLGPVPTDEPSLQSFFTQTVPLGLIAAASVYYSLLTASNIWRARRYGSTLDATGLGAPEQTPYRKLSNRQALRYLSIVIAHLVGMPFGFLWTLIPLIINQHELLDEEGRPWYVLFNIRDNLRQLPLVHTSHREHLGHWSHFVGFLIAIPINGILFFLMFGLGSDILGVHRVWLDSLGLKISDAISSIQKFGINILWPKRESSSSNVLENITPFPLDDIALGSFPPPVRKTAKGRLAQSDLVPPPSAIQLLSPTSPLHEHSAMDRLSPISPLGRSRTFRKEPIPARLLPINKLDNYGSPRDVPSTVDGPNGASSSHRISRDAHYRPSPGRETSHHANRRDDSPPPYEPSERRMLTRQESTFSGDSYW